MESKCLTIIPKWEANKHLLNLVNLIYTNAEYTSKFQNVNWRENLFETKDGYSWKL